MLADRQTDIHVRILGTPPEGEVIRKGVKEKAS